MYKVAYKIKNSRKASYIDIKILLRITPILLILVITYIILSRYYV